ncbi:MAG TPA: PAS domain S-box protein [Blastocatellia bacterium]|nr:PAS domain S-box protein [Blastocatellia bacterium]
MRPILRVLMVEDSEDDAALVLRELRRGGYDPISERVDTAAAMSKALDQPWDIVTSDHAMPHFNSREALELLRQRDLDLPFIIVSGTIGEEEAVAAMRSGAHDYILKQSLARLVPAVNREMREAAVRRERRQALRSLHESEEKFRAFVEASSEWIWSTDQEWRFTYNNPAITNILGYSPVELFGRDRFDLVPDEDRADLLATLQSFSKRRIGWSGILARWRHKDGGTRYIESSATPIINADGKLIGYRGADRDITERKRAEQHREANAKLLRQFVEHTPAAIAMFDTNMRYLVHSRRWLTDYRLGDQSLVGLSYYEVFPGLPDRWKETHRRCMAGAVEKSDEDQFLRTDGTLEWLRWEVRPWHTSRGSIGGIIMFTEVITERKRTEGEIERLNRQNELILNTAGEGIFNLDTQGRTTFVNPAGARMLGWDADEIIGQPMHSVLHHSRPDGSAYPADECPIYAALQDSSVHQRDDEVFWRKDGTAFPVEYISTPIREHGEVLGAVVVFKDITERKKVEEALRASEERFSIAFNSSPHPMSISTFEEGRLIDVNDSFLRSCGYEREEVIGRTAAELNFWIAQKDRARMTKQLQEQGSVSNLEFTFRKKSGEKRLVLLSAELIELGSERCVLASANDVTDLKLLEEQLRQSQKLEAIGSLAGGVAHDFNNILTAIIGYSQLVLARMKPGSPHGAELGEVVKAGERAAGLTRQLLAFSRRQVLTPEVLDLNTVVTDTGAMLRRLIGEDIEMRTVLDPNLARVEADPGQIEQVLMNLVINARDAMPMGGKLIVETANVELDHSYAQRHASVSPGSYVMLAVTDQGCGMDAATRARIFEPFFTTKVGGKGTGLGLSTVYGIVQQSGGHIWVYSELGLGTTLKVYLPRVDDTVREAQEDVVEDPPEGWETALVVEDDEVVRQLVTLTLQQNGYNVLEAPDGPRALMICEEHLGPIHLLITDVVMPQMGGRTLADIVARQRPDTKVIFMSGYTDSGVVELCNLDAGAAFIQKPFTPSALARKVREVLDGVADTGHTAEKYAGKHD